MEFDICSKPARHPLPFDVLMGKESSTVRGWVTNGVKTPEFISHDLAARPKSRAFQTTIPMGYANACQMVKTGIPEQVRLISGLWSGGALVVPDRSKRSNDAGAEGLLPLCTVA